MIFNFGGSTGGGTAKAALAVEYPAGSVCRIYNEEQSFRAAGTTGQYIFTLPVIGDWTVTISNGDKSQSAVVTFDEEYSVRSLRISYERDFDIREGFSGLGYKYTDGREAATFILTELPDGPNLRTEGSNTNDYFMSDEPVDLTGFTAFNADFIAADGSFAYTQGLSQDTKLAVFSSRAKTTGTVVREAPILSSAVTVRTEGSVTLDVSDLSGSYYIGFKVYCPNAFLANATFKRLWLE